MQQTKFQFLCAFRCTNKQHCAELKTPLHTNKQTKPAVCTHIKYFSRFIGTVTNRSLNTHSERLSLPAVTSNWVLPAAGISMFVLRVLCAVQTDGPIPRPEESHWICVCVCNWVWSRSTVTPTGRRGQTKKETKKEHDVKLCSETQKNLWTMSG